MEETLKLYKQHIDFLNGGGMHERYLHVQPIDEDKEIVITIGSDEKNHISFVLSEDEAKKLIDHIICQIHIV